MRVANWKPHFVCFNECMLFCTGFLSLPPCWHCGVSEKSTRLCPRWFQHCDKNAAIYFQWDLCLLPWILRGPAAVVDTAGNNFHSRLVWHQKLSLNFSNTAVNKTNFTTHVSHNGYCCVHHMKHHATQSSQNPADFHHSIRFAVSAAWVSSPTVSHMISSRTVLLSLLIILYPLAGTQSWIYFVVLY